MPIVPLGRLHADGLPRAALRTCRPYCTYPRALSRFDDPARFARELTKLGFKAFPPEERGSFTYIEARKTRRGPVEGAVVRFREKSEE